MLNWVVLLHTLAFALYWLTNGSYHREVNAFLKGTIGVQLPFVLIFLLLTLAVGLWAALRLILSRRAGKGRPWGFAIAGGLYLLFFYGSFIILFMQDPSQPIRLGQFLQYFRIVPDAILLLASAWVGRRLLKQRAQTQGEITSRCTAASRSKLAVAGIILLLWLAAFTWPPGSVYRPPLPEKPLLIAHRGASMLAPENTLTAAEMAASRGAYGFETDLSVSRDGTLFLMHDATLARTTDVADVFPERANEPASNFSLAELRQLSAGRWFVEQDPFGAISAGLVSASQAESYRAEPIPTLAEVLAVVRAHHLTFIYDLREPPEDHPYSGQALMLCLEELAEAGVAENTWVLTSEEDIPQVQSALPDAQLAAGVDAAHPPAPQKLLADGYRVVNSEYTLSGKHIRAYLQAGLWVNLWTVDEPWQFSRLWLLGASSTTTNNLPALSALEKPLMGLTYWLYTLIWGAVGLLVLGIMIWPSKG
jgi:glycerophosphoryl diester phosphodiesterase